MPDGTLRIEPSEEFGIHVDELRTVPEGPEVFTALLEALVRFRDYDFRESFPKFYSRSGNAYVYRFHPQYVLTFTRRIETPKGRPEEAVLELWTIQKA